MKIFNFIKNNYRTNVDGTVYRGVIEMNIAEFVKATEYLQKEYKKATEKCDTYVRDSLRHVLTHRQAFENKDNPNGFGVCATGLVVHHFIHSGTYKPNQNYCIKIV